MMHFEQCRNRMTPISTSTTIAGLLVALAFLVTACVTAQGQTFTVLHSFAVTDGAKPFAGVTMDAAGNLYGTTEYGGVLSCDEGGLAGCGVVYKLRQIRSNWILSVLYEFPGQNGFLPTSPGNITIGPNGLPYGTELQGGAEFSGTVFELLPSPMVATSVNSPWLYHVVHTFGTGNDGGYPSQITFDRAGNIFGATSLGGDVGDGIVYELSPAGGDWMETILYSFLGGSDGDGPGSITLDEAGNIYGTTTSGGNQQCHNNVGCGTVYELTRSGSGWTKTILHVFQEATEGGDPGPAVLDSAGNLFGLTGEGASGNGGTIWELSPSNGSWTFTVLYTFPGPTQNFAGPFRPVMDSTGALYGVNNWGGANNFGSVYKLAPSQGNWMYTDLHDFGSLPNQGDGCYPRGPVALDAAGNIYGAAQSCGEFDNGDVFEVTPQSAPSSRPDFPHRIEGAVARFRFVRTDESKLRSSDEGIADDFCGSL
jgi:uncharacterized repeat protein (TIGR03803 family)